MWRWFLGAATAAAVAAGGGSATAQNAPAPGQVRLTAECKSWAGDVVAVVCDPEARFRGSVRFPGAAIAEVEDVEGDVAVAQVDGDREPLLPGERLVVTVTTASPAAQLLIKVAAARPDRQRTVVLDRVVDGMTVSVGADLAVTVTRGAEVTVLAAVTSDPPPLPPTTPEELAARIVGGLNASFAPRNAGLTELCWALDPAVRPFFDLAFGDPEEYGCPSLLYLLTVGDENVPHAYATSARLVSLRPAGPEQVLLTLALVHRYDEDSNAGVGRIALHGRALLRRVADGSWRLADPRPLLALSAVEGLTTTAPPLATLRARAERLRLEARRVRGRAATRRTRQRTASSPIGGPTACARGARSSVIDPAGDAAVDGGRSRTRLPAVGATVDLVGATLVSRQGGAPCLELDFAEPVDLSTPLRLEFDAEPVTDKNARTTIAAIELEAGRVVAIEGNGDELRFLPGARAAAEGKRLIIRVAPAQWRGPITREPFVWTVTTARDHPFAQSISDETRRTAGGRGSAGDGS